jgi:hypothetical protein
MQIRYRSTTDALAIYSYGTSSDVLTIKKSDGNVGIGTTSPAYKLDVSGEGNFTNYLNVGGSLGIRSSGWVHLQRFGDANKNVAIGNDGTDVDLYVPNGKVGIGTTVPGAKLHVNQSGTSGVQTIVAALSSTSLRPVLQFSEGTNATITAGMSIEYNGVGSGANNYMAINSVTGSPQFVVMSGGNVGIGTTDPNSKLEVNVGTDQNVAINSYNSIARISSYNDAFTASEPLIINGSDLRFDISGSERMRINSSGNVGIGTTSPDAPLTVTNNSVSSYIINVNMADDVDGGGFYEATGGMELYLKDTSGTGQVKLTSSGSSYLNGGNVGIGTTSPSVRLVVADGPKASSGTLSNNSTLDIYGVAATSRTDSATVDMLRLHRAVTGDNKGSTFAIGLSYYADPGSNLPRTRVDFKTTSKAVDDSDATNTVMSLVDSGNVGIGTTSPNAVNHSRLFFRQTENIVS